MLDRSDIQGLVFGSYGRCPVSCALLVSFESGDAASWLARLLPEVSSALAGEARAEVCLNVAFSFRGLERLGLPGATLAAFAPEFRQGMAHRSLALGDRGEDDPGHWEFRDGPDGVDALLLVYARDASRLEQRLDALDAGFEHFGLTAREVATYLPADGREHFGFRMGVSEPSLRGRRRRGEKRVALGEFLLGHRNGHGEIAAAPIAPRLRSTREPPRLVADAAAVAFGFNGTYLAVRKLEQRAAAFWRFAAETAASGAAPSAERGAARLVGRWPNGAPLALYPDAPPSGPDFQRSFGYRESDPRGLACPLGAHVRRANPRDALGADACAALRAAHHHRLLRRGRLYGPRLEDPSHDDGVERGLLFVALNADLGRQFEHVQGRLRDAHFAGLRGERDPVAGGDTKSPGRFTVPAEPVRRVLEGVPKFVRVRGGSYFFLPSLSALGYLADLRHTVPAAGHRAEARPETSNHARPAEIEPGHGGA